MFRPFVGAAAIDTVRRWMKEQEAMHSHKRKREVKQTDRQTKLDGVKQTDRRTRNTQRETKFFLINSSLSSSTAAIGETVPL